MKRLVSLLVLITLIGAAGRLQAQEGALTLEECVAIALEHNPDLVRGRFTLKMAGKDVTVAMSNFLPSVSASMGYNHSVLGPSSVTRIDPTTGIPVPLQPMEIKSWSSNAGLSANITVFNGGYNIYNYKQSRHLAQQAEHTFVNTRQTVLYTVKERYYNLLKAEKLLEVAEETLKSSEESFKKANVLYEVGKASKSDALKARVQIESDRLSLIRAENSLAIARASLNYVLGFDVDKVIKVVDNLEVPEVELAYPDAMANAVMNHPQLKSSELGLLAAKDGVGMAVSRFLPRLGAFYGYSWRNEAFKQINNMFDSDYNWYAGFSLSLPVFSGFSRNAMLSKAKLNRNYAAESVDQIRREIALEVKQAYFEIQQSKRAIEVAESALEAAEEDLKLNQERYSLGAGTMLDLINAQVSYTTAKSDRIQSLYTYKYAIARLQKAMGLLEK
ncbi:TolC family protein [bacterium]|nr:TolC family protein [bacterium]